MTTSDHAETTDQEQQPVEDNIVETLQSEDVAAAYETAAQEADATIDPEKEELREQMMRFAAECENLRRRSERDIAAARDYAVESFAGDMADVLENLIRALDSAASGSDISTLVEGVDMTRKAVVSAFERQHIRRVHPLGEKFDHNFHQAVARKPAENGEDLGTVIEVYQSGYTIKDRLLKPAIVVVAGD